MNFDFDVDIDLFDRDKFLNLVKHIPASQCNNGQTKKHNTGVYFQNIPFYPLEGYSTLNYKDAAENGFFKVDFLNNHIYENVRDEDHLDSLINEEPLWELLDKREVIETLFHLKNYADLVISYKPCSVEQLSILLALVRPSKKHMIGKNWKYLEQYIWEKPVDGSYAFKKGHAIAYSVVIVIQLNLLREGIL